MPQRGIPAQCKRDDEIIPRPSRRGQRRRAQEEETAEKICTPFLMMVDCTSVARSARQHVHCNTPENLPRSISPNQFRHSAPFALAQRLTWHISKNRLFALPTLKLHEVPKALSSAAVAAGPVGLAGPLMPLREDSRNGAFEVVLLESPTSAPSKPSTQHQHDD